MPWQVIPSVIDPVLDEVMVWRWIEVSPGLFDRERRWVPLSLVMMEGGTYLDVVYQHP